MRPGAHVRFLRSLAAVAALPLALGGCREEPQVRSQFIGLFDDPPGVQAERLVAGPRPPDPMALRQREMPVDNPYEGDRAAIGEGRRLYLWMNCVECHGQGGGSIGPILWDDQWIYGGYGIDIFKSIFFGRPNGMPAYGGHLPPDDIWRIVAYVQQLEPRGGLFNEGVR
jgi:cytochrome c oxidase cbb3-type subunit III